MSELTTFNMKIPKSDKERIRQRANAMGVSQVQYMLLCERKAGKALIRQFAIREDAGSYQVEGE